MTTERLMMRLELARMGSSPRMTWIQTSETRVRSIARCHRVGIEIHVTVRFGPQANAARYRLRQHVLEVELAVEITLDLWARVPPFWCGPRPGGCWIFSIPFPWGAFPFPKFQKDRFFPKGIGT